MHDQAVMTHEDWARLCFPYIVAEHRGKPPLICDVDEFLPLDLLSPAAVEAAVLRTYDAGATVPFVAYNVRRQARTIALRQHLGRYNYFKIDDPEVWHDSEELESRWAFLRPFIERLPFVAIGRIVLMFSNTVGRGILHFDHDVPTLQHEFVWFKPTGVKEFFIRYGSRNHYVTTRSCWFDSRHMHQADEGPNLEISMRVDGVFAPELRQHVVARCAETLGLSSAPYVLPPIMTYTHHAPSHWERARTPRHYVRYFATLVAKGLEHKLARTGQPKRSPA